MTKCKIRRAPLDKAGRERNYRWSDLCKSGPKLKGVFPEEILNYQGAYENLKMDE